MRAKRGDKIICINNREPGGSYTSPLTIGKVYEVIGTLFRSNTDEAKYYEIYDDTGIDITEYYFHSLFNTIEDHRRKVINKVLDISDD